MTYPNIDLTLESNGSNVDTTGKTLVIDEDIKPLIEAVALKYPQWQIKARRFNYTGSFASATELKVYEFSVHEKRENLGTLGLTWYNRERAYFIENHRISNQRERGYGTKTKDLKKALRHIAKNFSPKVADEKIHEAREKAHNTVRQLSAMKTSDYRNCMSGLLPYITEHIISNWDELSKLCVNADGTKAHGVDKLVDFYREYKIATDIAEIPYGKQTFVVLDGSDYILSTAGATTILSSEQLPPHIKLGLGMLKLVEPRVMMKGIGCKVDDNTFVIVPPAPNNVISN